MIQESFGLFDIDLMATRLNTQCSTYFSWQHDPGSIGTDAFMQEWKFNNMYAFPPFSVIGRLFQKVEREQLDVCVLLPLWPTQFWFGKVLRLIVDSPRILPTNCKLLHLPQDPLREHALADRLRLTLFPLSGNPLKSMAFRQKLPILSIKPGKGRPKDSIGLISQDGCNFAVENRLILCKFL